MNPYESNVGLQMFMLTEGHDGAFYTKMGVGPRFNI